MTSSVVRNDFQKDLWEGNQHKPQIGFLRKLVFAIYYSFFLGELKLMINVLLGNQPNSSYWALLMMEPGRN